MNSAEDDGRMRDVRPCGARLLAGESDPKPISSTGGSHSIPKSPRSGTPDPGMQIMSTRSGIGFGYKDG